jgi:SAM-dependent methyltransferase
VDILFDLKLYTGGGRAGILAYRPAPVQAAYLGFPGSAASADIDYIISDRFVTPDSSAAYYTEKFCRLPHSYQCNDRRRFVAAASGSRAEYGLPEGKVVFGAFNQTYKIDHGSFSVWLRILKEIPDSVLWLLGQSPAAVVHLTQHAQGEGVDPNRLIFAPFAAPADHLKRLPQVDAALDTLVCNGHTTTSDALWAGVPVITARGRHFASRVSESLLNAMQLPELVASDPDDMVRIAKRIATDSAYRTQLRAKVAAHRLTAPLYDTARFTRDFEAAIELIVQRHRDGLPPAHLDVPDRGPVQPGEQPVLVGRVDALQTAYPGCPLCDGPSEALGFANCTTHVLWHEPLPISIEWNRCSACGHVHSRRFWSEQGLAEVNRKFSATLPACAPADMESRRVSWTAMVEKAVDLVGGYRAIRQRAGRPIWVDVGTGDGSLIMTALDYGFAAVGLDTNAERVSRIQALGFNAMQNDFMTLRFDLTPDVISMTDFLAHVPYPREALRKAAAVLPAGGLLVLSTPDNSSSSWRLIESAKANPYWTQLERLHIFDRERLIALLGEAGFDVVQITASGREMAHIQIYAVRSTGKT